MPSAELSLDEVAELIRTCRRLGVPHFRLGDLEFRVNLAARGRRHGTKIEPIAVSDNAADGDEVAPADDGEREPEDYRVQLERRYAEARKAGPR